MRVLMLGWEFPPFITGGLGTACHGLTRGLARLGTQVLFVLPRAVASDRGRSELPEHVRVAPSAPMVTPSPPPSPSEGTESEARLIPSRVGDSKAFANVQFVEVPSTLVSPYQSSGGVMRCGPVAAAHSTAAWLANLQGQPSVLRDWQALPMTPAGPLYEGDVIEEARRYADLCLAIAAHEQFDVVHAHDWMTYPAGLAVAAATGKPLVVHVHSTEFDRSGSQMNRHVYEIERRGMHGAIRVIAVSHLTRAILTHRYGVSLTRIDVVYNGLEEKAGAKVQPTAPRTAIDKRDKIVLFLGRVTMQKGPEYFIHAAKKVLEKYERVKFVVAGSGDQIAEMIELAARQGVGHKVLFTGFLDTPDVERIFQMADLYVMPSVSEPFGIACLEAVSHDVPVLISRTSGVSEVLRHALTADFWDIDDLADKIIAVLRHPPLSRTLRRHADLELRRLTWDDAAARMVDVYRKAIRAMP
ncbi:MAG: glycosyltransferase [Phycisphaeraceae bacterium]